MSIFAALNVVSDFGVFPSYKFHFLCLVTLSGSSMEHWVKGEVLRTESFVKKLFPHE